MNPGSGRKSMLTTKRLAGACLLLCFAVPAAAQRPPTTAQRTTTAKPRGPARGFIAINAGLQAAPSDVTDQFDFTANAESGTIDARYPARPPVLLDAGAGFRFWRRSGLAVAMSRTERSGAVTVRASVPHPLFNDRDRLVEGEASDLTRSETAAHLQLFYEIEPRGKWRGRLFGGPSYVTVEQELVRSVTVNESYPFDEATFRSAVTGPSKGSGVGFSVGADVSWMVSRHAGAGLLVRYARADVDLNAPDSRTVSISGGGLHAGAGLRFAF